MLILNIELFTDPCKASCHFTVDIFRIWYGLRIILEIQGSQNIVVDGICKFHEKWLGHIEVVKLDLVWSIIIVLKVVAGTIDAVITFHDAVVDHLRVFRISCCLIPEQIEQCTCGRNRLKFVFSVIVLACPFWVNCAIARDICIIETVDIASVPIFIKHEEGIHHDAVSIDPTSFLTKSIPCKATGTSGRARI